MTTNSDDAEGLQFSDEQDTAILGAYRAIEEAIYLEDGLDGLSGEAVLKMLSDAFPDNVPRQTVAKMRKERDEN